LIVIGIDPGTVTGLGTWDANSRQLLTVTSLSALAAMDRVRTIDQELREEQGPRPLVILEDARKSRMGRGGATYGQVRRLQGVGSVKRDSALWVQFLEANAIPYALFAPRRSLTKWPAPYFRQVTGWTKPTNGHARDAACLVFGLNPSQASAMLIEWQQRQDLKPAKRKR
jgi:hypothetical protein